MNRETFRVAVLQRRKENSQTQLKFQRQLGFFIAVYDAPDYFQSEQAVRPAARPPASIAAKSAIEAPPPVGFAKDRDPS